MQPDAVVARYAIVPLADVPQHEAEGWRVVDYWPACARYNAAARMAWRP